MLGNAEEQREALALGDEVDFRQAQEGTVLVERDLAGQLTVELPAVVGEDDDARKDRVDAAVEEIADTNGVVGTRLLDQNEVKRLLAPWLGEQASQLGVTLPDLVAVSLQPGVRPNLSELAERLQVASPGAVIDDHADFNARAINFLRTIEVLAVSLLILVLVATAGVVAFVARAGLSIHRRIVEIVHLVGAHDSYVARQFQAQAFRYGFLGSMLGTLLAVLTLVTAGFFAARGAAPMGAAVNAFEPWMVWPLATIPLAAVLIAMITVRLAVLHSLRKMAY